MEHELLQYATVAAWVEALPPTPAAKRRHLDALARWVAAEGADPDALIAHGRETRDNKLDAMRRLKKWVESEEDTTRTRHDLENAVRSFYIFHGLRVLTKPYSDVYKRSEVAET